MEQTIETVKRIQTLLKLTYGLIPIAAGLDKFTNLLADWHQYLNPGLEKMLPFSGQTCMSVVGMIEIVAGILVLIVPQKGGYLVSAWLMLIALTLIAGGNYFDVAVRDIAMAIGAFSLARISGALAKDGL